MTIGFLLENLSLGKKKEKGVQRKFLTVFAVSQLISVPNNQYDKCGIFGDMSRTLSSERIYPRHLAEKIISSFSVLGHYPERGQPPAV